MIDCFDATHASPQLLMDGDEPIAASAMVLHQFPHAFSQAFDTMSDALTAYYEAVTLKEDIAAERRTLTQALTKQENLLQRKAEGLHADLGRAEKADDYRIQGELLLANLHMLSLADRNR